MEQKGHIRIIFYLATTTKNVQQEQEHIDEIQIKHQRPEDRQLFRRSRHILMDRLESLGIVSGQADENRDAAIRNDPIKSRRVKKNVHNAGDDHAPKSHCAKTPDGAQVLFGHPSVHTYAGECHGGDKKG